MVALLNTAEQTSVHSCRGSVDAIRSYPNAYGLVQVLITVTHVKGLPPLGANEIHMCAPADLFTLGKIKFKGKVGINTNWCGAGMYALTDLLYGDKWLSELVRRSDPLS